MWSDKKAKGFCVKNQCPVRMAGKGRVCKKKKGEKGGNPWQACNQGKPEEGRKGGGGRGKGLDKRADIARKG